MKIMYAYYNALMVTGGDKLDLQKQRFSWDTSWLGEYGGSIYLNDSVRRERVGEFAFITRQMKKLDPNSHLEGMHAPYPFEDTAYLEELRARGNEAEWAKRALIAYETKPSIVAYISMWTIDDVARGNLAVLRQLFRVLLPELKKRNISHIVGLYVSQGNAHHSEADYAEDMYKRLAHETGGEIYSDGNIWVPVEGLEEWVRHAGVRSRNNG